MTTSPAASREVLILDRSRRAGISAADHQFLDDLQYRSFRYFLEQTDLQTGMTADRAPADGGPLEANHAPASIAAVGFALTAWCIGVDRSWISQTDAANRTRRALRFLLHDAPHRQGFFYHFMHRQTGERFGKCEFSSIDTALLMAGVLTVRQYFRKDPQITELATALFDRVDWPWMLNGGSTLSMGYKPRYGFLRHRWDNFSEHPILYLMAMGSSTHPLPASCWHAWERGPVVTYDRWTFMQCPALFVHQFPHAWIDFRKLHDDHGSLWHNSVNATLAHRQAFIDLGRSEPQKFGHYGADCWGITSSDSPRGYQAWGGPPMTRRVDGTVVPCAAAGSLPFAPTECLQALRAMHRDYGHRVWKRYGFVDAFNPRTGWQASDAIGIDVGITLLMAENLRTGGIWRYFMQTPEIRRGLAAAGFRRRTPRLRYRKAA